VRVAVVGGGMMGHGIAQVFAVHGHEVTVYDQDEGTLATVRRRIAANLEAGGHDPAPAERVELARTLSAALAEAEVVFEAVFEDLALKQETFVRMEAEAPDDAILATNTSVLQVSEVTQRAGSRWRMLGTHWWNPPHLIPLVEVVPGAGTEPAVVERMVTLLRLVGKEPVAVKKDTPGFVGNRLQHALWREAFALVDEGVCDPETVDKVVKNSFGLRLAVLGPVENADLVGLDLTAAIHRYLLPHLSRATGPARVLEERLAEGHLGMKTGQGLRRWSEEERAEVQERLAEHLRRTLAWRAP
jgi:3-hydroxybutyryl-CoA dehydrogenase